MIDKLDVWIKLLACAKRPLNYRKIIKKALVSAPRKNIFILMENLELCRVTQKADESCGKIPKSDLPVYVDNSPKSLILSDDRSSNLLKHPRHLTNK